MSTISKGPLRRRRPPAIADAGDDRCERRSLPAPETTVARRPLLVRGEIITGIGEIELAIATRIITDAAASVGLPVTVTIGTGYHPAWGDEPVMVITTYQPDSGLVGRLAELLRGAFHQDAVVVGSGPAEFQVIESPAHVAPGV